MHVPPHFHLTVRPFDAWRRMSVVLLATSGLVWAAWALMVPTRLGVVISASGVVLLACAIAMGREIFRQPVHDLQWDTQAWYLALASDRAPVRGGVEVAIDLGAWMLLRFRPEDRSTFPRTVWLPLQRGGLETRWHALRLTLHGAQLVRDPLAALP